MARQSVELRIMIPEIDNDLYDMIRDFLQELKQSVEKDVVKKGTFVFEDSVFSAILENYECTLVSYSCLKGGGETTEKIIPLGEDKDGESYKHTITLWTNI